MKVKNHKEFARTDYNQNTGCKDIRKLGQIVYRRDENDGEEEIGVIIQVHEDDEFRTDKFGNCCSDEVRLAKMSEIRRLRPELVDKIERNLRTWNYITQ